MNQRLFTFLVLLFSVSSFITQAQPITLEDYTKLLPELKGENWQPVFKETKSFWKKLGKTRLMLTH